ncbi:MAG: redoxin domain-containing protein [Planctomycetaceae bacterium]|nr:redoxin domain-containing protein [Planctomycetaceae bacterium]
MTRRLVCGVSGSLALIVLVAGGPGTAEAPIDRGIGSRLPNFTLKDAVTGKPVTLYQDYLGRRALVIVFLGTDCPLGNLYVPRLAAMSRAYRDKGVAFLGINANAHEAAEQVAEHARTFGINFPVLKDTKHHVADLAQAERTCEALVLDGRGVIRYRGAIDDQYGLKYRKAEPSRTFLRDAIDAVLAGKAVAVPATPVVGCLLDRVATTPAPRIRPSAPEIVAAPRVLEGSSSSTPRPTARSGPTSRSRA